MMREARGPWRVVAKPGVILGRLLTESWIDVDKSASHQLSQNEIDSDNPCYRHLFELGICLAYLIPCAFKQNAFTV